MVIVDIVLAAIGLLAGILASIIALVTIPFVLYQSLYRIGPNEMVVSYYWGSCERVWVNTQYWNDMEVYIERLDRHYLVEEGLWHGGWAFCLWPVHLGYKLPTDQFDVPVHASRAYTSTDDENLPRVRMSIDGTLQFRLAPDPGYLGMVFPLFGQGIKDYLVKEKRNLTNSESLFIEDDREGINYTVKKIAHLFYNVINKPVIEAVRTAATYFTFSTSPVVGSSTNMDIIRERGKFEDRVMIMLAEDADTVFRQARLLREIEEHEVEEEHRLIRGTDVTGESLMVCNFVAENVQLQPAAENESDASRSIDFSFIGHQEGLRQQAVEELKRVGIAKGVKKLAEDLGLDDNERAYLYDVLRNREGNIDLNSFNFGEDQDLASAIRRILRGNNE